MNRRSAFSLIEVLVVVMLISAGILPIYSLIKSGQRRIVRADIRTIATLYGASAMELARTLGFDRSQKLADEKDFLDLIESARKNGLEMRLNLSRSPLPSDKGLKPNFLLRVEVYVKRMGHTAFGDTHPDFPELRFYTILSDPRYNYY